MDAAIKRKNIDLPVETLQKLSLMAVAQGKSLKAYIEKGVRNVLCTDISKDGMMQGPAIELYKKVMQSYPSLHLIASGGVSCNKDIARLDAAGIPAVVFGKAFYEGKIDITQLTRTNHGKRLG